MTLSPALRIRAASAALALVAGVGLIAAQPAAVPANAADEGDLTESAVTLSWADGVIGADGEVVQERDPSDPRYQDFEDLEVTVSQTEDMRRQSVHVTWSGGLPTFVDGSGQIRGGYLQLMQCWGDENAGPAPENCVWGVEGLAEGPTNMAPLPGSTWSRDLTVWITDPALDEEALAAYWNAAAGRHQVPFRAVGATDPVWDPAPYYDRWTSNEFRRGLTTPDGTGERYFSVQDGVASPHLGCGRTIADGGGVRDCWLVIVPRGAHEVTGADVSGDLSTALMSSPLSPTNWAQRIQVHLDFASVDSFCPIEAKQRPTIGSELMATAMYSWQRVLCAGDGPVYGFSPASDSEARRIVSSDQPSAPGMGFTAAPVTEVDGPAGVLHAPVAISGVAIGFNLVNETGARVEQLRLTPRLVAKMLTQSYWRDLPGLPRQPPDGQEDDRPEWIRSNAEAVVYDPEFRELNPQADPFAFPVHASNVLKVPAEPSDAVRDLWRWIFGDDDARAWLGGEPDEHGMTVNPFFREQLAGHIAAGTAPDIVPRDVEYCYEVEHQDLNERRPRYCSLDLLPYTNGFEDSAGRASTFETQEWVYSTQLLHPNGQDAGWYSRAEPRAFGVSFALTDTVSAARYGLATASLRNAAGEFVPAADDGLRAGVEAMVPSEVDGVLEIDPEASDPSAYPLSAVTYAAVRTEQEDIALADYAHFLEHAAGPGQTPGWSPGELRPGYVPLPDDMREQTLDVAAELLADDPPDDPRDPSGIQPPDGEGGDDGDESGGDESGEDESGGGQSGGPDPDSAGDAPGGNGDAPDPASFSPGAGDDPDGAGAAPPADGTDGGGPADPTAPGVADDVPVALSTPAEPVGPMQYALLAVLIAGLVGALGGPALLKLGPRAVASG